MFSVSIHTPLRERREKRLRNYMRRLFQSTLPRGSDVFVNWIIMHYSISIHAPSRERRLTHLSYTSLDDFNPRSLTGATCESGRWKAKPKNFNPRSLTGATRAPFGIDISKAISIHAPSRERLCKGRSLRRMPYFNPRSLTGATTFQREP